MRPLFFVFGLVMTVALYTDLSHYYDLMCADIDYQQQSDCVRRLHHFFGNQGRQHIDLACGTGPHLKYFIDYGFHCQGLDINQPMLDIAKQRCPQATFTLGNMTEFKVEEPVDLISCFLYSLHYCADLEDLHNCIKCVYAALKSGGIFCFNAVDKHAIDNSKVEHHHALHENSDFTFTSAWHYVGQGDKQSLLLSIEKTSPTEQHRWQDQHPMVAVSFTQLQAILSPYFDLHIFQHEYDRLIPWDTTSGNAIFVCVKR